MNVFTPIVVLMVAMVLLTFSLVSSILAPPVRLDSRDVLVLAEGVAGLLLIALASRRFLGVHRALMGR